MTGGATVLPGRAALTDDPAVVGGKAANLALLAAAGVPVPAWIVLPAAAYADAAEPSDALLAEVTDALAHAGLADAVLAVRSSAVGEDAAGASFAGQFETVLGVAASDRHALRRAIATVWASASAERVLAYRGGASVEPPRMAVILQELVDAEAAGVAFSADPITGDRSIAVVSAVRGLGESLVSGEEDGDSFRIRMGGVEASVVEVRAARQERVLQRHGEATRWVELTPADTEAPAITADEAVAIARAACRIAVSLGAPQDVEWALERGGAGALAAVPGPAAGPVPPPPRRLVILQARPITTLPEGERRIWDNSNIVESYAGVTTPLTFSFARSVYEDVYRQFCGVMGVSDALIERNRDVFAHMLGLIRGRVYYNLLSWYRLLALLPGYAFNRAFMERMMGVREKLTDPPEPQLVAGKWTDLGRLVRMVFRMVRASRALRREVPAFHRRLDEALLPLADADLSTWPSDDLLALYRRLEDDLLRHWQPPLVNDFFAMIWFGVLGRLMERWLPGEPATLVNDLLAGEGGMISTEPARRVMALAGQVGASPVLEELFQHHPDDADLLAAITQERLAAGDTGNAVGPVGQEGAAAAFAAEFRSYLRRFGDRCANELKLETVTLSEDPVFLVSTIRSYLRQGATDPDASREREAGIRAAAEARVAGRLTGARHRLFRSVLGQARARIRDRENLRFERTRVFGVVRRIFLGFGAAMVRADRIDEPRDIFWLATGEVFGWADGTAVSLDLRSLIAARRAEFAAYETGLAPPERFETWGPPAEADLTRVASAYPAVDPPADGLVGIGCCPGVVRAPVRLVRDPREAGDLGGRILVAERTDPGWTLLFPSAAGILVQRGSLLSHSAIVAREMGIPCVVSVPGLMDSLQDGELVEMDGATGTIRRLDGEPEVAGEVEVEPPQ
jgi:rifampicin phosphotransferase